MLQRAMMVALLLVASPVRAALYEPVPGVTVVGWERLSPAAQGMLTEYLAATPRALTPWLRVITIDGATVPEPLASELCAPNGEILYRGACGFNVWSSTAGGEDPFPPDAPERVWVNGFVAVVNHEYAHQIGHGTSAEQWWVDSLLAEAGDEPQHYLRSMVERGYFRRHPQEFLASMWNQWGTCSRCTLRLALSRWDSGNPHPLNHIVLLIALSGFRHGMLDDRAIGTVVAYDLAGGLPMPELWSVAPWACGVASLIQGPGFALTLTTDAQCRVTAIGERRGV